MHQQTKKKISSEPIQWEAPEFQHYERARGWYIWAGLVALGLLGFAVYNKSLITFITFALIILVGFSSVFRKPKNLIHRITSQEISVGQTVYPYKNIKQFWINYQPPEVKTLNFETTAYLNTVVTMQLDGQDPVAVKMMLKKYLPEDLDREESLSEVIARRVKF